MKHSAINNLFILVPDHSQFTCTPAAVSCSFSIASPNFRSGRAHNGACRKELSIIELLVND